MPILEKFSKKGISVFFIFMLLVYYHFGTRSYTRHIFSYFTSALIVTNSWLQFFNILIFQIFQMGGLAPIKNLIDSTSTFIPVGLKNCVVVVFVSPGLSVNSKYFFMAVIRSKPCILN